MSRARRGGLVALALALALAGATACRGPAPAAPPVEPDLCHASVGWRGAGFAIVGLPCVSRDGAELLYARSADGPGGPELAVAAVTRGDRRTRYVAVMEPNERGELLDAGQGIEIAWTATGRLTISHESQFVHGGDCSRWLEPGAACAASAHLGQV